MCVCGVGWGGGYVYWCNDTTKSSWLKKNLNKRDIVSFFKLYTVKMWSPMKEMEHRRTVRAMYRLVAIGDNSTALPASASENTILIWNNEPALTSTFQHKGRIKG